MRTPRAVRALHIALAVVGMLAGERAGLAQPLHTPAGSSNVDRRVDRAEALYRTGRYDEAIAELEAAYALEPLPWLLLNIAQAHRLKGDHRAALDHYREFLELAPGDELAEEARENVELMRKLIADADPDESAAAPPPSSSPVRVAQRPPSGAAVASTPPDVDIRSSRGGTGLLWTGGALGVLGLAAAGVGIAYGLEARRISDELTEFEGTTWPDELLERQAHGELAQRRMIGLVAIGTGTAVTGAVLMYFGVTRQRATRGLQLTPAVGAGTGVSLQGEF